MQMDSAWKTANLTLIGPFAIAIAGVNVSVESRGVARSAPIGLVDSAAVGTKLLYLDIRQENCSS
jgi:hypothetical protein